MINELLILNLLTMEWIYPLIQGEAPAPRTKHDTFSTKSGAIYIFGG